MMWRIRAGAEGDALALAELAESTFRETYVESHPADVDLYCARTYSPALQRAELVEPAVSTLVAECDGRLIAYAQVNHRRRDDPASLEPSVELTRVYVQRPWQGRGVAQGLLRAAAEQAAGSGAKVMRLCVWERNARAIRFYTKLGFRQVGEEIFVLGTERQRDLVMTAVLAELAHGRPFMSSRRRSPGTSR